MDGVYLNDKHIRTNSLRVFRRSVNERAPYHTESTPVEAGVDKLGVSYPHAKLSTELWTEVFSFWHKGEVL